jgi:hypothetical protein
MGIYIFSHRHSSWYKIGSFKTTPQKPNVYYRVVGVKGFETCRKIPESIKGKVGVEDMMLVKWYPNLNMWDEKSLYYRLVRLFPRVYGEWIWLDEKGLRDVFWIIENEYMGIPEDVSMSDRQEAIEWGLRQYLRQATNVDKPRIL